MSELCLPHDWLGQRWWTAYVDLVSGRGAPAYARLAQALTGAGHADLAGAIARSLVVGESPLAGGRLPSSPAALEPGERALLSHDLNLLSAAARRELTEELPETERSSYPRLSELAPAPPAGGPVATLRSALLLEPTANLLAVYLDVLRSGGGGQAALYPALRWLGGSLEGVPTPAAADLAELVGLDEQLGRLTANTEALLAGKGAHNALLYGPRGSGKSTTVRGLLTRYAAAGLRLVELPLEELGALPDLLTKLSQRPQAFVLYVDDLAFEDGDPGYRPLKTLLEGGLAARPRNVALYATSNRRHLVKERFSHRPDPLDDDVHRWDTHHERLALADRFGLVITFPDAGQRRYLEVVSGLAHYHGIEQESLQEAAIRFAEWGNGYSGRTAAQFIDSLKQRAGQTQPG